jgi:uncharacterized membrane protein
LKTVLSFRKIVWALFAFIGLMIIVRVIYSGKLDFIFLVWNLFLAWIPFTVSTQFKKMLYKQRWKQAVVLLIWLLFFPNALYIVTYLIHLEMETTVPKWYDAILLFSSCITGLMMAFVSLLRVEKYLCNKFSGSIVNTLILSVLFLGSFGVYLGRFLRWNSWDILSNPLGLFFSIAERFIFPFQYLQTWGITLLLTTLFYLLYLAIKKLPGYLNQATH